MEKEEKEELGELIELLKSLVVSDKVSQHCLLDLNYRIRKNLEKLICDADNKETLLNLYYLLGDNYEVIRRDLLEAKSNLLQILPLLDSLAEDYS